MNMQKLMKQAAQIAEQQRQVQESTKMMETIRIMILATTVNDLINEDAIDKTLQKSADKVVQSFTRDCKASKQEIEELTALANLIKVDVKKLLIESAKIMRVKS